MTFSGGEPMEQAGAISRIIDLVRVQRDLSFMSYTGYTLKYLLSHGSAAQQGLIKRLDLLVDGPYIRERHTRKRWRGSDNQIVHFLSHRHDAVKGTIDDEGDWIDVQMEPDGTLLWMGIPPIGFRERLEGEMASRGIEMDVIG